MQKNRITFVICCISQLIAQAIFAQSAKTEYTLTAIVIDSVSRQRVTNGTVSLNNIDNSANRTATPTISGIVIFEKVQPGDYILKITVSGYKQKEVHIYPNKFNSIKEIVVDSILLTKKETLLKEVLIVDSKPLIKQQIDRLAYDVQADPDSKVLNVLDMLRKVPLVSIGIDDGIQIKGNSNFKVLINGRPAPFPPQNITSILKSMPSGNIQRIEIITTPPAKYDGEGLAGLINIVMVKRIADGYSGSFNANYSKLNSGIANTLNLKDNKFGLTSLLGFNDENKPAATFNNIRTDIGPYAPVLLQNGSQRYSGHTFYINEFVSYELDTLNLITASVDYNTSRGTNYSNQFTQLYDQNSSQSYQVDRTSETKGNNFEIDINYQLSFKNSSNKAFTASYNYSDSRDVQQNLNFFSDKTNFSGIDFAQNNRDGLIEQTAQIDYANIHKKLTFEAGGKFINRNNFSTFNSNLGSPPAEINDFKYLQEIYGLYNSYGIDLGNWGFKGGARLEITNIDVANVNQAQKYTNLIPSLSAQRILNQYNTITFGYTQRIQRPSITQLNPFIEVIDPKIRYTGNPNLLPVLNHSFELSYSNIKKGSLNVNLSYVFSNNTIQPFWTLVDSISTSSYKNIGKIRNLGLSTSIRYPIIKNASININGRLAYVWLQGVVDNNLYKNDGFQGFIYSYISYTFLKTWRSSVNGGFYGPTLLLQGKSNSYFYSSFNLSKRLAKGKLVAALSVSNPFKKYRLIKSQIHSNSFDQNFNSYNYFRNINFSLSYNFGRLRKEIKRADKGIDNDDKVTIPK